MWALNASTAVAFHYGATPPWDELQAFDLVVVDPDHVKDPASVALPHTQLAAYVSVGEVHPSRSYAARIPKAWLRGANNDWGSLLVDQTSPQWPAFFADTILGPLWKAGYRAFFLDTLDSYQLFAKTAPERAAQEAALVQLVTLVKQRYPQAQLIYNRGFEILDRTHHHVAAVAAESLLRGFVAASNTYREVPHSDRQWLLAQLEKTRKDYGLPVIVIDYVPVTQRALARSTARQIAAMGFVPWVATPDLSSVGIGLVEPLPRKVMVVQNTYDEYQLRESPGVRVLTMPLNYLGYSVEYVDLSQLPDEVPPSRYAGVVVWLAAREAPAAHSKLETWLGKRLQEKLPLVVMSELSPLLGALKNRLGLESGAAQETADRVEVVQQAPMVGFEREVHAIAQEFSPLTLREGTPLLTLRQGQRIQVAAAITPWGGYVSAPFAVATLPTNRDDRWVIDPFAFLKSALQLPDMPVPDVTTESGRRMLLVHMDGDGFISRSELPGNPLAAELVRDRIVNKYRIPMAISVIEAELSKDGLYPGLSAQAERIARDIFAADHVELASHSYSHPFKWGKVANPPSDDSNYNLRLPGYRFNLQREIEGSIRYIENQLAPPGKKVKLFLWTGDCVPGRDALEWTQRLGVANMNGGDTVATRSYPSVTQVEGLGMERKGLFQVFAPNQNENVYTNEWRGPFYGFDRVIETFEFTEKPRRLKPINIYFHTYVTTKAAGMRSMDKIFAYALAQETTPVFASDYAHKVQDFSRISIARTATGWRVRGTGRLRTLRVPTALGTPDLRASDAVAGYATGEDGTYLHVLGTHAQLRFAPMQAGEVRLVSANARIDAMDKTETGYRWALAGHVPLAFTLAHDEHCVVRVDGREVAATHRFAGSSHYQIPQHATGALEAVCRR